MDTNKDQLIVDKSTWGEGPWQHEPDRIEWRHKGMACLMVRHERSGHWCGYVGLPPDHPWYGKAYSDDAIIVDVHGGLTYSAECHGHVCHVAQSGEPEHVWWIGFDCAHYGDLSPGMESRSKALGIGSYGHRETYCTATYVRRETNKLAKQVVAKLSL